MPTDTLFEPEPPSARARPPASGLLVTNHLNLLYMLAAGLVMPPAGFGDKYYRDTLGSFPGWIPLFIGRVPAAAIDSSSSEAAHLRPAVLEIGLSGLSGRVLALGPSLREIRFPDELDGGERLLLVPAPLPSILIEAVLFPSREDRSACEADAKDFGNVPLGDVRRRVAKTLFTRATDDPWPTAGGPPERAVPLDGPMAAAGVMAMLLLCGDRGDLAVRSCRQAFDPEDPSAPPVADPILSGLRGWMRSGDSSGMPSGEAAGASGPGAGSDSPHSSDVQATCQARLFWGAVDGVVAWKRAGGGGSAEEALLDYLETASKTLDARLQAGAGRLRDTLSSLRGLVGATAGELFERHATPLARAMTLFFLRRDCADLLDFEHDRIHEQDRLAAAVLFGVRDGWLGLPLRLRAVPGLSAAVSHRMAQMAQRLAGADLDLGDRPPRVQPLRELFGDGSSWGPRESRAALELARAGRWDCLRTRISLPRGAYRLTIEGGAVHIELPGEPRITPQVDPDRFFACLAGGPASRDVQSKVRGMLRS
ncbi:MAG: hypothetical protein J4G16_14130 [Acidobacteria bacterium]|nr:hypothetical protein [Acidobacteriota bacterium]